MGKLDDNRKPIASDIVFVLVNMEVKPNEKLMTKNGRIRN